MEYFQNLNHVVFLLQDIIATSLFMYLGLRSFFRKWYLSEAATKTTHFYTNTLKAKITLNVLVAIFYVAVLIYLLFLRSGTVLDPLRYLMLFPLVGSILESDLLLFQYRRGISSKFSIHGLTWICLSLCSVLTLYAYLTLADWDNIHHYANVLLTASQVILFVLRAVIQLTFPQDEEHFTYSNLEEMLLSTSRVYKGDISMSSITESDSNGSRSFLIGDRSKRISTEFSIAVKSAKKAEGKYLFQVNVTSVHNTSKIFKSYSEFVELHEQLRDKSSKLIELPKLGSINEASLPQAIMQLQKYFDSILQNFDPIPDSVLSFLNVTREQKFSSEKAPEISLEKPAKNKTAQSSAIRRNFTTPQLQEMGGLSETDIEAGDVHRQSTSSVDKDFCPYIMVALADAKMLSGGSHYEYTFSLSLSEYPEEQWMITKRYKEFSQLVDTLANKKIKLPKLPPARLMTTQKVIDERKIALTNFLRVLLNEEVYLACEEVAAFVSLSRNIQKLIFQNKDKIDFSHWWVRIIENKVKILPNNIAVTEFVILVHAESPETESSCYKIYKRMLDFEKLYSALAIRFGKDLLPQLPAKFNAFFSQTSVEFRMTGLENFLNALFKVPNIEDCFAFRKFINAPLNEIQRTKSKSNDELLNLRKSLYQTERSEAFPDEMRMSLQSQTDKLKTISQLRQKGSNPNM